MILEVAKAISAHLELSDVLGALITTLKPMVEFDSIGEAESLWKQTFDAIHEGILVYNREGRIMHDGAEVVVSFVGPRRADGRELRRLRGIDVFPMHHNVPVAIRDQAFYELAVTQVLQNRFGDATSTVASFAKVQTKGEWYERARLLQGQVYWQQGNLMAAANEFRLPGSTVTLPDRRKTELSPR